MRDAHLWPSNERYNCGRLWWQTGHAYLVTGLTWVKYKSKSYSDFIHVIPLVDAETTGVCLLSLRSQLCAYILCLFHVRSLDICKPKILACFTHSKSWSLTFIRFFLEWLNVIRSSLNLVLFWFKVRMRPNTTVKFICPKRLLSFIHLELVSRGFIIF